MTTIRGAVLALAGAMLAAAAAAPGTSRAETFPACGGEERGAPRDQKAELWRLISIVTAAGQPCTLELRLDVTATGAPRIVSGPHEGRLLAVDAERLSYVFDTDARVDIIVLEIPIEPLDGHATVNVLVRAIRQPVALRGLPI